MNYILNGISGFLDTLIQIRDFGETCQGLVVWGLITIIALSGHRN